MPNSTWDGYRWGSNQEADRLVDGRCESFSESLRAHADLREAKWLVQGELLKAGADFYEGAQKAKSHQAGGASRAGSKLGAAKKRKLRDLLLKNMKLKKKEVF